MTTDEIIKKAGSDWQSTRCTMKEYIASVIEIARKDERESLAKTFGNIEIKIGDNWVCISEFIRTRDEK